MLLEEQKSLEVSTTIVDFQNVSSANLCEDLERLLETGYAELIHSADLEDAEPEIRPDSPGNETSVAPKEESPFPKGLAIYDYDEDEDDEETKSPSSGEENLLEGEYEVICSRDISSVPLQSEQHASKDSTMLGAGAQFMMGKASRLIGSFFRH